MVSFLSAFGKIFTDLLTPSYFSDYYVSTAVQGCHVAFGALAYAIERDTVRDRVSLRRGLILAMCAVSAREVLSLAVYGGSWLDRWNNAAFMMGGVGLAYATWRRMPKTMGWITAALICALLANAWVRL